MPLFWHDSLRLRFRLEGAWRVEEILEDLRRLGVKASHSRNFNEISARKSYIGVRSIDPLLR
jgi:hypothetical protein